MRKLKILHIGNGTAFKIKTIINFFKERGHEIHFIPVPPVEERWGGITYHALSPYGRFSKIQVLKNIFSVRQIVNKVKPDVVHSHNATGTGWYGALCGHHPFVLHAYGSDVLPFTFREKDILSKVLTLYSCRQADSMIVTGKHMVNGISHLGVPEEIIKVIPRGVNLDIFRSGLDTSALRNDLKIDESSLIILSPRYQIDAKLYNFDTIIESILYVKKIYPEVIFIQLYDVSLEEDKRALENMANDFGVSANYKIVKAVDNDKMPYFYNLADIVVSVPSSDGFPVSVLEASACATPMVLTELDFTAEWFVNGENGILIPERDPESLADAIVKIAKDKSLQQKMIKRNRSQVEERADYNKCMKDIEDMYYALLANHSQNQ